MRLDQDVRYDDFVFQFRVLAPVTRVLVSADVIPGPAVKAALLDVGDVIGRQIIPEFVTLVDRGPELAGLRVCSNPHWVADAPGVDAQPRTVWLGLQDVRAVVLDGIFV